MDAIRLEVFRSLLMAIAEEMGIGLSAAKMRVKRGREAFRARFEDDE